MRHPNGLLPRLRDPADSHIDIGDFIPGGIVHHTGLGQIKNALEGTDCVGGEGTVDAVGGDDGDGRVIPGDAVELVLHLQDFFPGRTNGQSISGPGGRNAGDYIRRVDVHIVAVVIAYNLDGGVALVSQILGTPLAQAGTGNSLAVAVRGKNGLPYPGPGQVVGKYAVHQKVDILVSVASVHPFLVISGGGGDGKIVALVSIPRNSR